MRIISTKASQLYLGLAASILLLASGASMAQSVVGAVSRGVSTAKSVFNS